MRTFRCLVAVFVLAAAGPAAAAPLTTDPIGSDDDVVRLLQAHYTKREARIPMRDGKKLFTHIWVPKGAGTKEKGTLPFLLMRTPYSVAPYGVENLPDPKNARGLRRFSPSFELLRSGYIIVHQDVRGRLMSEGDFLDVRPLLTPAERQQGKAIDESTDAYDTVAWLLKNVEGHNGKVGVWGISYPGFYAAHAAVDAHPAVKAVSPQAPVTEWFLGDDFHHNGAFCLADAFSFYQGFGRPRPAPTTKTAWDFDYDRADAYDFYLNLGPLKNVEAKHFKGGIPFWQEFMRHETRDAFWQTRDPRPHYKDIRPAVLVVGGWYDAEDLWGTLETYRSMNSQSPGGRVQLVMGPWAHGGWARTDGDRIGDVNIGQKTSPWYRDTVERAFFEHHLKGAPAPAGTAAAEAIVFENGTNEWRTFAAWPPPSTKAPLYLGAAQTLQAAAPATDGADRYVSDPSKPVPVHATPGERLDHAFVVEDQRHAARRPDVLVYQTDVLATDVTVGGPLEVELWVETTGTDADFVVKLIDVLPEDTEDPRENPKALRLGGAQRLVRGEIMRGRYRESFEKPQAFAPNTPTRVRFTLPDTLHTFRAGHRVMVQVQSSWFPLFDRNPQTFVPINTASEKDFVAATHTVHRSKERASKIVLPIVRGRLSF